MTYIDLDEEEIFEDNKTLLGLRYQDMEEIKATGQVPQNSTSQDSDGSALSPVDGLSGDDILPRKRK